MNFRSKHTGEEIEGFLDQSIEATKRANEAAENADNKAAVAEEKANECVEATGGVLDAIAKAKVATENATASGNDAQDKAREAYTASELARRYADSANGAAARANEATKNAKDTTQELQDDIIANRAKADNAVSTSNTANANSENAVSTANAANASAEDAVGKAEEAINIAKGRATGYVFDTKADLDAWLLVAENKAKLVLGDNLYIRAVDTPDYWWDGNDIQQLETEHPDLTQYVKDTDWATASKGGVVKIGNGVTIVNGVLHINKASDAEIAAKSNAYKPIVPANLDYAIKVGLITNTQTLTDAEKANAKKWLGFEALTIDEYEALTDKSGINFVIPEDYDNQ